MICTASFFFVMLVFIITSITGTLVFWITAILLNFKKPFYIGFVVPIAIGISILLNIILTLLFVLFTLMSYIAFGFYIPIKIGVSIALLITILTGTAAIAIAGAGDVSFKKAFLAWLIVLIIGVIPIIWFLLWLALPGADIPQPFCPVICQENVSLWGR